MWIFVSLSGPFWLLNLFCLGPICQIRHLKCIMFVFLLLCTCFDVLVDVFFSGPFSDSTGIILGSVNFSQIRYFFVLAGFSFICLFQFGDLHLMQCSCTRFVKSCYSKLTKYLSTEQSVET